MRPHEGSSGTVGTLGKFGMKKFAGPREVVKWPENWKNRGL